MGRNIMLGRLFGRTKKAFQPQTYSDQTPIIPQHDEPIIPQHDKPKFLTPTGKPCYGAEEKYHFIVFDCFRTFGEHFNSWRDSTPFRLQELSDTRITYRLGELDLGPNYGHRYEIFYYQSRVGLLQISTGRAMMTTEGLIFSEAVTDIQDYGVSVQIFLDAPARMIPYDALKNFLFELALMLSSDQKDCYFTEPQYRGMTQHGYAIYAIEQAMMGALWDNAGSMKERQHEFSLITVHFAGTPTEWYKIIAGTNKSSS
jgi:hypothetical protein